MDTIGDIMRTLRFLHALPIPARNALRKLGADIRDARLRRRLSTTLAAQRAFLNRKTLRKIENGDAGVSIGAYASLLFVLGMTDRIGDLADARFDRVGLTLEEERLPKRVRARKKDGLGART
jgi:transcriptional regulator with XRE-family HTH domain